MDSISQHHVNICESQMCLCLKMGEYHGIPIKYIKLPKNMENHELPCYLLFVFPIFQQTHEQLCSRTMASTSGIF